MMRSQILASAGSFLGALQLNEYFEESVNEVEDKLAAAEEDAEDAVEDAEEKIKAYRAELREVEAKVEASKASQNSLSTDGNKVNDVSFQAYVM